MTALILSGLWFLGVVWLIWRALRQRDALQVVEPAEETGEGRPKVCVVVPARDEAENIARCLRSLTVQRATEIHVVVVDDDSSDATPTIATALAREDPRITLLRASALPAGWKGKSHACCIGAKAAPADADWLCFMDADVTAHPSAIISAVASASAGGLDLLSLMPRQELRSFAERLIMPCGLYLLAFTQDVAQTQAQDSDDAAATGQFMLFRRIAYEAAGGHAAVHDQICEDVELARRLKRQGKKVLLQDGAKLLTARMYTGWETLWPGIAKNLSETMGGPVRTGLVGLIALVVAWAAVLLPIVDVTRCAEGAHTACVAAAPAVLGAAAALALHVVGAVHFAIPPWYGLLFPIGYSVGAVIGFDSLRWRLTRRVRWKGRVYS